MKYGSSQPGLEASRWQEDLACLVEAHPELEDSSSSSESESELDEVSDVPESMSSSGESLSLVITECVEVFVVD